MKTQKGFTLIELIIAMMIVFMLLLLPVGCSVMLHGSKSQVTATVTEKERICESGSSGDCRYLIFTDKEVLENTDTLLGWKFDSSDYYNAIKVDQEYVFDVWGWRMPFFSMYRNILSFEEVQKESFQ